jgi:hypothetical protein
LRFLFVFAFAFIVVGKWDVLRNYWDRLTRGATHNQGMQAISKDTEYFCPMCPGVVSDWPSKCPVCNMALVRRKRGEAVPLPDGVVARMQLSPYRLRLAGVQTSPVEYQPLVREIAATGFVDGDPALAGFTRVSVTTEVFEKDLPFLAANEPVEARSAAYPGREFHGHVQQAGSRRTAGGGTFQARLMIDNPRQELRPGMFITARIKVPVTRLDAVRESVVGQWSRRAVVDSLGQVAGNFWGNSAVNRFASLARQAGERMLQQADRALAIPESALVDTGSHKVVYVETMPGMFDGVEVVLGPRCGDFYPVLAGLQAGQRVATAGAFLIDAETRLNPSLAASYFGAGRRGGATPSGSDAPTHRESDDSGPLAGLSAEDRAVVNKQKVCPVTQKPLGSMGPPVRVAVQGRIVFLCCEGCEAALKRNPEKYLSSP